MKEKQFCSNINTVSNAIELGAALVNEVVGNDASAKINGQLISGIARNEISKRVSARLAKYKELSHAK